MRLSSKELAILGAIVTLKSKEKDEISLDAIIDHVRPELDPQEQYKYFRSGVLSSLRNLQRKLPREGLTLLHNEMVGRGHKAIFTVAGDYAKFVKLHKEQPEAA